jgi:hypothetical protein
MIGRRAVVFMLPLGLSACASPFRDVDIGGVARPEVRDYDVVSLNVTVPRDLVVSEENVFYPSADIVWRGEPFGDRHAQVQRVFEDGMRAGARTLDGSRPVDVDVEVRRFHSLTEKARYTVGGVHSIRFLITVTDARTGEVVEGPRFVSADREALGGQRAIEAEQAGRTERVMVVNHLAGVAVRELRDAAPAVPSTPAG